MTKKPSGYWTYERCKEEALKYNTLAEFIYKARGVYSKIINKGWFDELCSHLIRKTILSKYWTYEICEFEALKYTTLHDLYIGCRGAWRAIRKHNWNELILHFKQKGNTHKRLIYVYEFSDNHAYVGLTYNLSVRNSVHLNLNKNKSSVGKYMKKTNLTPILKQLTEYIDVNEAIKLEEFYRLKYLNEGWCMLNKAKTGGIGGCETKWTKELCYEEAIKYKTREEFKKGNSKAYNAALDHSWINDITIHMLEFKKYRCYWTYERCQEEALKYTNKKDFSSKSPSAFDAAAKHHWIKEICAHMEIKRKSNGYWSFEKCQEEALKYKTMGEFKLNSPCAYTIAQRDGWMKIITSHIEKHEKTIWTKEKCIEDALKYKKLSDWVNANESAVKSARKNGWLNECILHMPKKINIK